MIPVFLKGAPHARQAVERILGTTTTTACIVNQEAGFADKVVVVFVDGL
jgi:hypothetical protein